MTVETARVISHAEFSTGHWPSFGLTDIMDRPSAEISATPGRVPMDALDDHFTRATEFSVSEMNAAILSVPQRDLAL